MDRKEIKAEAREKIKGNIWNILWPILVIGIVGGAISTICQRLFGVNPVDETTAPAGYYLLSSVVSLAISIVSAGYIKYLLDFVRKGKFDEKTIIETVKTKWQPLLVATILGFIIIYLATLLLIIPGIIMGLAYSFIVYIILDNDINGKEALTKSREMMKGYKWDFFVFNLSFLGWIILGIFTLGILYIWLIPYMSIAEVIYYERLKKIKE